MEGLKSLFLKKNEDENIERKSILVDIPNDSNDVNSSNPSYEPHNLKIVFAGMAGNILEWYDFGIFGYFSDEIAKNFFPPNQEENAALVETFAVYGLAFLARPIGGLIIGKMGDTHGRKGALETTVFYMAFSTFAMGVLPTYEMVGPLATVLLILTRLIQGLSVGGQLMSSMLFTLEKTSVKRWGFMSSAVFASVTVGVELGSVFASVINDSLTKDEVDIWGWRIPFLFGLTGILPALYLKYRAEEVLPPQEYSEQVERTGGTQIQETQTNEPIRETLRKRNFRALMVIILAPSLNTTVYYLSYVWLFTYMTAIIEPPIPHAFNITSLNLLGGFIETFCAGLFVDWVEDYGKVMLVSSLVLGISSPVAFGLIGTGGVHAGLVAAGVQFYLSVFLFIYQAAVVPWVILKSPTKIRLTLISLGWNISLIIWGGFSPTVATILVDQVNKTGPGYMVTVASALALIALWLPSSDEDSSTSLGGSTNELEDHRKPLLE